MSRSHCRQTALARLATLTGLGGRTTCLRQLLDCYFFWDDAMAMLPMFSNSSVRLPSASSQHAAGAGATVPSVIATRWMHLYPSCLGPPKHKGLDEVLHGEATLFISEHFAKEERRG